jgi:signal recognition particle subunit SRP54
MSKGQFDMNDLRMQLKQMQNMGGLGALAGMIPGLKKAQTAMASAPGTDKMLVHMDAIIGSMTPKERAKPELLQAKRKIRIAKGAGVTVQEVNKLLKMHQEMAGAMKKLKKMGGMKALMGMMGGAKGMGGGLEAMLGGMGGAMPGGMPSLPPGFMKKK